MTLVFVYGSLLRGAHNHHVIEGAALVGEAVTEARYGLYDLGDYPALVEPGFTAVHGEIYRLPPWLLAEVDAFEGHPLLFERRRVALTETVGVEVDVEAYFFRDPVPSGSRPIVDGRYIAR